MLTGPLYLGPLVNAPSRKGLGRGAGPPIDQPGQSSSGTTRVAPYAISVAKLATSVVSAPQDERRKGIIDASSHCGSSDRNPPLVTPPAPLETF